MAIEVHVPTMLRPHTGGARVVNGRGETLVELFADLDKRYAGLGGRLTTDENTLGWMVNVYVNDMDVRLANDLEVELNDGDTVTIHSAVAGGALAFAAALALRGTPAVTSMAAARRPAFRPAEVSSYERGQRER